MTSEIAVMNQRAVAMAADSAVTLIGGGTVVVRNEQRKLFNLMPGQPVGLMFFGVADIMGHPWDQLIGHYQKAAKPGHLPHVRDYAAGFTAMLDHLEEFFPRDRQKDEYKRLLASVFRYVLQFAHYLRQSGEAQGLGDVATLEQAIALVWRDYQFLGDGTPRPDLGCFPEGFGQKVRQEHGGLIEELIGYGFATYGLSQQAQKQLHDIAVFCVVKDLFLEDVTGLVFAGFGAEDRYPVVVTWYLSAIVLGIAKRTEASHDGIDSETKSKIRIFADSEVTTAFIRGIDFNLERQVYGGFGVMMQALVDQVVDEFPAEATARESVRTRFQGEVVPRYLNIFQRMIAEYQQKTFINPVLRVLEIATRSELGDTARELVSLNVFKKRIMAQRETVGGAIDVAVISRDDGFQWWPKGS
ncbi:MAG: hypothetical protein KGR48_11795 [Alphaproteobacteria bacterium]|nr:hypothetical protein [Alphaproteobacteria bacterium]MDE2013420.1 hypothetical protein [Alphaproteobacteria bacterium]MDE2073271.1 hypothetical protein [Alphaproteobacteria bacterium]MDE2351221.1 hypothetical protein [Alphaproteobacteria bacterium]